MHPNQVFAAIRLGTLLVLSWICVAAVVNAQEQLVAPAKVAKADEAEIVEAPDTPQPADVAKKQEKRSMKLFVALVAIAGIAVLGVGAIAMNMLWARRLRRLARDSGPKQTTVGNDFWFLKPPKPPVSPDEPANRQPPSLPPESRDA